MLDDHTPTRQPHVCVARTRCATAVPNLPTRWSTKGKSKGRKGKDEDGGAASVAWTQRTLQTRLLVCERRDNDTLQKTISVSTSSQLNDQNTHVGVLYQCGAKYSQTLRSASIRSCLGPRIRHICHRRCTHEVSFVRFCWWTALLTKACPSHHSSFSPPLLLPSLPPSPPRHHWFATHVLERECTDPKLRTATETHLKHV